MRHQSQSAVIKRRRRVITPVVCVTINNQRLAFLFRANRIHTGLMHMLIACLHTCHELARSHAQLWPCPAPVGMDAASFGPARRTRTQSSDAEANQGRTVI